MNAYNQEIADEIRKQKDIAAIEKPKYPEVYQKMGWSVSRDLDYIEAALTTKYTGSGPQRNRRQKEARLAGVGLGYLVDILYKKLEMERVK